MIITRGDFNALPLSDMDKEILGLAFEAISSIPDGWDFLRIYDPGHGGFMFSTPPPKMEDINNAILNRYGGHSGASYAFTMRNMEFIAKQGWDAYVSKVLETRQIRVNNTAASGAAAPAAPPAFAEPVKAYVSPCPCRKARGLEGWCGVAGGGVPACDH